jgi:hypothetical protein
VLMGWDLVHLVGLESPVGPQDDRYHDTMAWGGRGVHGNHQGRCRGRRRPAVGSNLGVKGRD